jgi:hypothetical protein
MTRIVQEDQVAVNDRKAADIMNTKVQTLRNWRHLRKGPPYVKMGRSVRYFVEDLLDYMKAHRIDPEGTN